jgi:hypothetical protein
VEDSKWTDTRVCFIRYYLVCFQNDELLQSINWADVIKKEARSSKDEDLGEVQEVNGRMQRMRRIR